MRLLDRYLLRELMIPLGYCLGAFFIFWASFDLLGNMDRYREAKLTFFEVVQLYLIRTPELLITVIPIALLLALLYALTTLTRHQEITAMRAAGIHVWRLAAPYLLVGLLLSGVLFAISEFWAPRSLDAANAVLSRHTSAVGAADNSRWVRDLVFQNERAGRQWIIGLYDRQTGTMYAPSVLWSDPEGGDRRLVAAKAIHTNGVWTFFTARQLRMNPHSLINTNELTVPELTETPEQIDSEIVFSGLSSVDATERPHLSVRQILNYQRLHPDLEGATRAKLSTQLHARLAEPWTCMVVVLIALPFGMPAGRRNVFVGVAGAIFIAFGFFVLMRFSLALGTGGYLPGAIAAWLPNLAFATTGILLTRRLR
jgi:lipopolysaccharide export system permease protein